MKLNQAYKIASSILEELAPFCQRAEIAGSIRRRRHEVKDIEIVVIPTCHEQPDLFGRAISKSYPLHDYLAFQFCRTHKRIKGGEKYIQYELHHGINLDLFMVTPPAQWGVQFVLRTGPAQFSHWLVTNKYKGGALPDQFRIKDGAVRSLYNDIVIDTPEESDLFDLLGLKWIKPEQRIAVWNREQNRHLQPI